MKNINWDTTSILTRSIILSGVVALVVATTTVGVFNWLDSPQEKVLQIEHTTSTPTSSVLYSLDENENFVAVDFTKIAEEVQDAVVHIKATQAYPTANNRSSYRQQNPLEQFFRNSPFEDLIEPRFFYQEKSPNQRRKPQARVGQGSGVLINAEGYIVTNNHVIADADDLEVTLHDNRTYKATVVGTDPTTDLALLQVKENGLPYLPLVNSDEVKVGEWVMAVGNPFNLTSTVTAGIVSAKGRNINILKDNFAVESFIQTDAAINPGNSGGALVNLQGGLIGINTAIASPTGAYSGYGFAVPANIVSKVIEDLMKYGVVQRGVLGVMIRTVDGNLKQEKKLEVTTGAYIDSLLDNSAAKLAGIRVGDVIMTVNDIEIESSPKLQEVVAQHRPGDEIRVVVDRKGNKKTFKVILNNRRGKTDLVKKEHKEIITILGADLENIDTKTAKDLDIEGGVLVKKLYAGKLRKSTTMQEGFIITKVNGQFITSVEELVKALEGKKGGVMLEGVYEGVAGEHYYAFGL